MLPQTVFSNNSGERKIFNLIANAQGMDKYWCLHSLGLDRHMRKSYAEADFVLIGPAGVFSVEVKGGEVRRKDGVWIIGWPGKTYTSTEGPFKQSQGCKWALKEELSSRLSKSTLNNILFGWGVAFPDVSFSEKGPEWDSRAVFDINDMSKPFIEYVNRLKEISIEKENRSHRYEDRDLSDNEIRQVVDVLRADFDVVRSLREVCKESDTELFTLSEEQAQIVNLVSINNNNRVLCEGGAGTGKTIVALQSARLVDPSKKVLFVCFNKLLAENIKQTLAKDGIDNVDIFSIFELIWKFVKLLGMRMKADSMRTEYSSENEFLHLGLARLMLEGINTEGLPRDFRKYDVLIVDEAQDILSYEVMDAISSLLVDGIDIGRWFICFDSALQSEIYKNFDKDVMDYLKDTGATKLNLEINYRNPYDIIFQACKITGTEVPLCKRTLPAPVDYITFKDTSEKSLKIKKLIENILNEGIEPAEISILSVSKVGDSDLIDGRFRELDVENLFDEGVVGVSTVSSFKGLENQVIIVTNIPEGFSLDPWFKSIMYVAYTRAKFRLFCVLSESSYEKLMRFREGRYGK